MAIIEGWLPASPENYETLMFWWQFWPVAASLQWATSWYGMGKTSVESRFNLPGKIGWFLMEVPGFTTLLYIMRTLPAQQGITHELPWQNKVLAGLFVVHYTYRAVLFPWIQPSMSPIHPFVFAGAVSFQVCNATAIGSWLAAYGPTSQAEWEAQGFTVARFAIGIGMFYVGLVGNYFADEELREIRRAAMRRQERKREKDLAEGKSASAVAASGAAKHYELPNAGLFQYMLFPHYFMEWVEWAGFWVAGGLAFTPARCFLLNEFFSMLPRTVSGRRWYAERFGEDKIRKKWVSLPGIY